MAVLTVLSNGFSIETHFLQATSKVSKSISDSYNPADFVAYIRSYEL